MYSVSGYGKMIADAPRMEAYVSALRQAVRPGSVVVDLGSGPGLYALLACQMGARRVYAIEPDSVIEVARHAAIANGYQQRLICIQDLSTRITLPEKADVIISDLRGILPWFQQHLPSIVDARRRLLKPKGILIPQRDVLWAALAEAPEKYGELVGPWEDNRYGFDLSSARRLITNTWRKLRVTPQQLLVKPNRWCVLDYSKIEDPDINGEMSWTISNVRTAHGLLVWFDSELIEGIGFSNHPGETELVYGNAFFPFSHPIELGPEDEVAVTLSANLVGEDYVWRWNTRVVGKQSSGLVKASFKQSSFFGVPLSLAQLHKQSAAHVPLLNDEGGIEHFILSLMDGKTALEEIARQLNLRFPDRFTNQTEALTLAGEVSLKYSQ
jgi:type I protein arginine methyltransferase